MRDRQPPATPSEPDLSGDVRVLIADADGLARNAIRSVLMEAGLNVVAQAGDALQLAGLARRFDPDVAVVAMELPPEGGLAAIRSLTRTAPRTRVVLLTASEADEQVMAALAQGAAGCLSREVDLRALAHTLAGVAAGEAAISRTMTARLIEHLHTVSAGRAGMRPVRSPLTTREWEVLDLLGEGAGTAEIARRLVVSPETVHSHVQHILRKLHAHSRKEAVEIARSARFGINGNGATQLTRS